MDFPVSSADARILLLLEERGTLKGVARELGRDVSVVSRQLTRIAEGAPLVEKIDGKWRISPLGRRFTAWARDSILTQRLLLKSRTHLRIATTREFASRILAPALDELRGGDESVLIEVLTSGAGVESALLKGEADIGFDCGTPRDPSVRFRKVACEPFAVVAAPRFLKRHPIRRFSDLLAAPHLQMRSRLPTARLLRLESDRLYPVALFQDIAAARAASVSGHGWAILPVYSVRQELEAGKLERLTCKDFPKIEAESFGVWWLRERRGIEHWVESFSVWLKKQRLDS